MNGQWICKPFIVKIIYIFTHRYWNVEITSGTKSRHKSNQQTSRWYCGTTVIRGMEFYDIVMVCCRLKAEIIVLIVWLDWMATYYIMFPNKYIILGSNSVKQCTKKTSRNHWLSSKTAGPWPRGEQTWCRTQWNWKASRVAETHSSVK